jgi:hypothetical protein
MTFKNRLARAILAALALGVLAALVLVHIHTQTSVPIGGHDPLLGTLLAECVVVVAAALAAIWLVVWAVANASPPPSDQLQDKPPSPTGES